MSNQTVCHMIMHISQTNMSYFITMYSMSFYKRLPITVFPKIPVRFHPKKNSARLVQIGRVLDITITIVRYRGTNTFRVVRGPTQPKA